MSVSAISDADRLRSSRRAFMGSTARRSAALAVEVAGLAGGIGAIGQVADLVGPTVEVADVVAPSADGIRILDRRDPHGRERVDARSTSELLRLRAGGAIDGGPVLGVAVGHSLAASLRRAGDQGQPTDATMAYAIGVIVDAVGGEPAVAAMLERLAWLRGSASGVAPGTMAPQVTAEATRFEEDVRSRHRSVADRAARRIMATTAGPCSLLLVGDGSRYAGAGAATTSAAARIIDEAGRLGSVAVLRHGPDDAGARWLAMDLARDAITARFVSPDEADAFMAADAGARILLSANRRAGERAVAVAALDAAIVEAHPGRSLGVIAAFGETAPARSVDGPATVDVEVVAG